VRSILKGVAFFLTVSASLPLFAQNRAALRITQAIDDRETTVLRGNVHPQLQHAVDQGRMDGATQLHGVSLVFKRTPEQDAAVDKLLEEQQDPASPNYHKWLTPEQYAERFGLSQTDLDKVVAWLKSEGFTVDRVARGRTQLWFSGSVTQIERVFRTEMRHYELKGESHFAMAVEPSIPAAIAGVVLGLHNVSSFRPKSRVQSTRVKANFTSNSSGIHHLVPADFATIYDVAPLYASADGTGQKIAIVGQSAINTSDIDAFRSAAGLPARTAGNFATTVVPSSGTSTIVSGDIGESSLDLEWAQGVAKGASELFVYVGNNSNFTVFDAFLYSIDQNLAPIVSSSYGNCEQNLPATFITQLQTETQKANLQGQTLTAASGDFGAADCEANSGLPAHGGLGVDIPGALPYVTSVGGTTFNGDADATVTGTPPNTCASATPFWGNSCSATSNGSALQYIPEVAWNDTTAVNLLSASGGGASLFFSKPSWQTGTGVPADGERDVPDVALAGSPNHDGYLYCVNDPGAGVLPCSSGFRDTGGNLNIAGGTSFGAPTMAGIVAILDQKTGVRQGNINPTLYALAASATNPFHDITSGNNMVPCQVGTTDCTSGTYGYNAGTGYDLVTGLGTIDATVLVNNWSAGNPTAADFTMFGDTVGISAPGAGGTSTITVDARNGYSGTINFTCAALTSAKIGCSVTGGPITLNGTTKNGTVTLSITTANAGLNPGSRPSLWFTGSGALFAGVLILGGPNRRRRWTVAITLLLLALVMASVGCGGSKSSGGGGTGTPVGNYTITVTGNDGTTSHTTSVLVSVL